jgi:hypothetical protein
MAGSSVTLVTLALAHKISFRIACDFLVKLPER